MSQTGFRNLEEWLRRLHDLHDPLEAFSRLIDSRTDSALQHSDGAKGGARRTIAH